MNESQALNGPMSDDELLRREREASRHSDIATHKEQLANLSTNDLMVRLSKSGVQISPATFLKMARKHRGSRAVAAAWKLNKTADHDEVAAIASLLWDKLCPDLFQVDALDDLLRIGYETSKERDQRQVDNLAKKKRQDGPSADETALREAYDTKTIAAIDTWLDAWQLLRSYAMKQQVRSLDELDRQLGRWLGELPSDWVQDLEQELENLAWREQRLAAEGGRLPTVAASGADAGAEADPAAGAEVEGDSTHWVKVRLNFISELRTTLPKCDEMIAFNLRRGEAESHFLLGEREEGDAVYRDLVRDAPHNAWSYIGWGDMYSPQFHVPSMDPDVARAREIYESGLQVVEDERDSILERIELLDAH